MAFEWPCSMMASLYLIKENQLTKQPDYDFRFGLYCFDLFSHCKRYISFANSFEIGVRYAKYEWIKSQWIPLVKKSIQPKELHISTKLVVVNQIEPFRQFSQWFQIWSLRTREKKHFPILLNEAAFRFYKHLFVNYCKIHPFITILELLIVENGWYLVRYSNEIYTAKCWQSNSYSQISILWWR